MNDMSPASSHRLINAEDLPELRRRFANLVIALGTGCFDLAHVGHVYFLDEARKQADLLVVGVNSDRTVRALKGDSRPIVSQVERATLVAALRSVDYAFVCDDVVADDCIRALRPDVYVTGAESASAYPTEIAAAHAVGARVHVVSRLPENSTTAMVARAQAATGPTPGR